MPALATITHFDDLLPYLRDTLGWPVDDFDYDDLTFDYTPAEIGLKPDDSVKVRQIRQLRPLQSKQPWGIFFVEFERKKLPVVILRRILSHLVVKKRAGANQGSRAAWALGDLLFITAFGDDHNGRELAFAHFHQETGALPTLRVLGWDGSDTPLKLTHINAELRQKLRWPGPGADLATWRASWSAAFRHKNGHVIRTADDLADRLAELAKSIRDATLTLMHYETDDGPLTQLHKAFQSALLHDLDAVGFADTYAQTITYGLWSAAIARTDMTAGADGTALTAADVHGLVPITNPFLRDTLAMFLNVGGRQGGLDFDALGVQDVVDLLRSDATDLPAIVRDFGNKTQHEDPVIHFYEHFLASYNKELKVQRGVFYTPRPVVSYIVRSVHELLQTEFGLDDGLADTATWADMAARFPDLTIPAGTDPVTPFVQILDPATGTGTFLVEVIEVIHTTLVKKWQAAGIRAAERQRLWNEYVPKRMLPRLYGYELMMAPYAIAHMRIPLKLKETGFTAWNTLTDADRVRVYLTNALEPAQDFSGTFEFAVPALAHESNAVNEVKRHRRFTVVVGNPPYSLLSANLEPHHRALIENYKFINRVRIQERAALQMEKNLNDDYVKFIRLTQLSIEQAGVGASGLVTNHSFLDNPTMRGMRWSLLQSASRIWLNDLHGNSTKQEQPPDGGGNENVFQIKQGVAITLLVRLPGVPRVCITAHHERWGTRHEKEAWLGENRVGSHKWTSFEPTSAHYLFVPQSSTLKTEFESWASLPKAMPTNGAGYITARDNLVIDFEGEAVVKRVVAFSASRQSDDALLKEFNVTDKKGWDVRRARTHLKHVNIPRSVIRTNYRPFDSRWIFFDSTLVWGRSWPTMQHLVGHPRNLSLLATRMTKDQWDVWVARTVSSHKAMSAYDTNSVFPLFLVDHAESSMQSHGSGQRVNFSSQILEALATALNVQQTGEYRLPAGLTPEDVFHYAYAVFRSPTYRSRYKEFLKIDFPHLPFTGRMELFRALARLGGELVSLHLMESPTLDNFITTYTGPATPTVSRVGWADETVWLDVPASQKKQPPRPGTIGFHGVPQSVWDFRIGGYQVCDKWLKDRKGRTLSADDIAHYQRIVVALSETIRLMAEIDDVIDAHGGWPAAFAPPEN